MDNTTRCTHAEIAAKYMYPESSPCDSPATVRIFSWVCQECGEQGTETEETFSLIAKIIYPRLTQRHPGQIGPDAFVLSSWKASLYSVTRELVPEKKLRTSSDSRRYRQKSPGFS